MASPYPAAYVIIGRSGYKHWRELTDICSYSAAIIHYKPERGTCSIIDPAAIYLCDSGAQYLDGTTDTTRTIHFGTPTDKEKLAYTLVLKGNIALDKAVFPKGTTGFALDALARQHLWVRSFPVNQTDHA
jgi:Xaa-Pro aminopeptidase